jgi:hypothetical protein
MKTITENITYLVLGTKSPEYVNELKPYLVVFHLSLLGLLVVKVIKVISVVI